MPEEKYEDQQHSEEVQEVIGHIPHWLIRWGITVILAILAGALLLAHTIQYPNTLNGKAVVSRKDKIVRVVAPRTGTIERIMVREDETVRKERSILRFRSPRSDSTMKKLIKLCKDIEKALKRGEMESSVLEFPMIPDLFQGTVENLREVLLEYRSLSRKGSRTKKNGLLYKMEAQDGVIQLQKKKYRTEKDRFLLKRRKREKDKELFAKGVIPEKEFEKRKADFLSQKKILQEEELRLKRAIMKKNGFQNELKTLIENERHRKEQLRTKILIRTRDLERRILSWKKKREVRAPVRGRVSFLEELSRGNRVAEGDPICALIPNSDEYTVVIKVPKSRAGELTLGQGAEIELDQFPPGAYGRLRARVTSISEVPNKDTYLLKAELEDGLTSTYGKRLTGIPELSGKARLITKEFSLLERLWGGFIGR